MNWNHIHKKIIATTLVIGVLATTAYADGNLQPGSADDPIVTKSYVDEQIGIAQKTLDQQTTQNLLLLREELKKELLEELKANVPTSTGPTAVKVEKLSPGQKLYGMEGTEIIVRSGTAKVIAGDKGDGIPNVTAGKDLAGGAQVPLNHLLIIPRSDNRGISITPDSKDVYVMIRGEYTITPAQ